MSFENWFSENVVSDFGTLFRTPFKVWMRLSWQASRENIGHCPKCEQQPPVLHCEQCGYSWDVENRE